ncbi:MULTISPECIES: TIGR02391 family protein [unclassified Modestobacter]|uniref:TIGR02391 family protein n=1 Tax=unclassified Modestobacter TaxID=2643866 RepID=UPI0022A9F6D9|nr:MULTISPECIES: TIGR02391 family protein [unclassified Modestobacter]MCZ2824605.1 TIGR02391 family protein [Modestobacter sp. VKM Ac-2981]MCZ2853867.1 TIGR02391 family protein [Modestobacter sp. VKM Ac-2982]
MRDAVEKFAATIHMIEQHEGSESEIGDALEELMTRAPLVETILESLEELPYKPDPSSWGGHPGQAYLGYRPYCMRAYGKLRDRQLIASIQSPGPSLSATRLHPWVWDSAGSLWNDGHHRQAVSAAAGVISAQTQALLGRDDVADQELMKEAVSLNEPTEGAARLRVAASMASRSGRALQQGALNLAQGVFGYIRNPATHETGEWDEQEALEKLATLSVLARMIEGGRGCSGPARHG